MAIIDEGSDLNNLDSSKGKGLPEAPKPESNHSFGEVLGAAFRRENLIGSFLSDDSGDREITDTDFDPFKGLEGTEYAEHAKKFVYADSEEEVERIKSQIDREKKDAQILSESGWVGTLTTIGANILDPTILIPGGTIAKAGKLGVRLGKTALSVGAAGAGATAIHEAGLQSTQLTRTLEESMVNVAAGAILGGAVGVGAGAYKSLRAGLRESMSGSPLKATADLTPEGLKVDVERGSVGAAARTIQEEDTMLRNKAAQVFAKASPIGRGLSSDSNLVRQYTSDLFEHNLTLQGNLKGIATDPSLESLMKIDQGENLKAQIDFNDIFQEAATKEGLGALNQIKKYKKWNQFNEDVAKAMRRGDESSDPYVAKAAKRLREAMDEATVRLQKAEILPDDLDVKTAKSYFSRRYDINKINANHKKFVDILAKAFKRSNPKMDDVDILDAAEATVDNIRGQGDTALHLSAVNNQAAVGKKFTKQRVLDIPDEELEEFLVHDAINTVSSYLSQASSLVRFKEVLARRGHESLGDLLEDIKLEKDKKLLGITDPEKRLKIEKEFTKNIQMVKDHTAVMLGQYGLGQGSKVVKSSLTNLRFLTYVSKLGGVAISSIPDIASHITNQGLPRMMKTMFKDHLTNFKATKLSKDQLKDIGIGLELEVDQILNKMLDPTEDMVGQGTKQVNAVFNRMTGISYWNRMNRRVAGHVSASRTIRSIMSKTMDKEELVRLNRLGIDKNMGERIRKMVSKYSDKVNGGYVPNVKQWSDREAADVFNTGVLKEVDSTILIPSKGELPKTVQRGDNMGELFKTLMQLKSFAFSAYHRIFLPLLNSAGKETAARVAGITTAIYLGSHISTVKDMIAGRPSRDRDAVQTIVDGINRSGVAGILGDAFISLNPWINTTRFATQNLQNFILGPSAGMIIRDLYPTANKILKGEASTEDIVKLKKHVPFMNLFYLQYWMNQLDK